jgi:pimeloyl-ACP methyl ester carboxylesterase
MTHFDDLACDITQFSIQPIASVDSSKTVLGYYVDSTAPLNVEELPILPQTSVLTEIREIARYLLASEAPQIVIAIHGYGTLKKDAEDRYKKMYHYVKQICPSKTTVFFGYHWPSEKPTGDPSIANESLGNKLQNAWNSLPILPSWIFRGGLAVGLISAVALFFMLTLKGVIILILVLAVGSFSALLTLILLRLSTYFRDNYRATNFGVLDLVELIRHLDQAISEEDTTEAIANGDKKIKLSFIGHSMGGFVVTNTIRILSDVFDRGSIQKNPNAAIGRVFELERLVLVAPDIPVETVVPSRANFLRSSLRRCREAYAFVNEGDLALRLASTTANYFSFPSKTRFSGYRLGNLTAKRFDHTGDRNKRILSQADYGIRNWNLDDPSKSVIDSPYNCLEIRSSDSEHRLLREIRSLDKIEKENLDDAQNIPTADLFTYFDCTDYVDFEGEPDGTKSTLSPRGVVSYARKKSALNLMDYVQLSIAYFVHKPPKNINVHGGYFDGVFSQQLIYKLAFVGFRELLGSLNPESSLPKETFQSFSPEQRKALLQDLSNHCQDKGIQVVLAPIRYGKDILGE